MKLAKASKHTADKMPTNQNRYLYSTQRTTICYSTMQKVFGENRERKTITLKKQDKKKNTTKQQQHTHIHKLTQLNGNLV